MATEEDRYHELDKKLAILCETTKANTESLSYLQSLVQKYLNDTTVAVVKHEARLDSLEKWRDALPKSIALMITIIQLVVGTILGAIGFRIGKGWS